MDIKDTTIYCDGDGVLVDFELGFEQLFSKKHSDVHVGVMWKLINNHESFWHNLPVMPDGMELWKKIAPHNPTILTGCPPGEVAFNKAVFGKRTWFGRELGHDIPVITCLSKNKPNHMNAKGDILIDDIIKNCNRWEEAGGRAIHHVSAAQTIAKLEEWGF